MIARATVNPPTPESKIPIGALEFMRQVYLYRASGQ